MSTATSPSSPATSARADIAAPGRADKPMADHEAAAPYLADFESFRESRPDSEPGFVRDLRARAIERFAELGFPTTRQEEWRFTSVKPITSRTFRRGVPGDTVTVRADQLAADAFHLDAEAGGSRLVFVDGRLAPELSSIGKLPAGVRVDGLARMLAEEPELLEPHLGRHASFDEHPFVALNSAFFTDGAVLYVGRGKVVTEPIHFLYVATGRPVVYYPRNLVVAEEASQVKLVETHVSLEDGASLNCNVTEIVAQPGAVVDHYRLQKESTEAFHMSTLQIQLERSANVFSHAISTGGALVRNDVNAVLGGEGAECTLNGLYVLRGTQFLDNHMRVDHAEPHCNSFELFKGILDEKSRAVFNGRIFVAEDAQKTDAKQSSKNLLLSNEALVNANPQLEIFADDVKCTHGSTVGQLDEEAIFYLRSRGIGERAARSLLTYAFASDIVERIKVAPVREELTEFLFSRLPRGEVVRQAV